MQSCQEEARQSLNRIESTGYEIKNALLLEAVRNRAFLGKNQIYFFFDSLMSCTGVDAITIASYINPGTWYARVLI